MLRWACVGIYHGVLSPLALSHLGPLLLLHPLCILTLSSLMLSVHDACLNAAEESFLIDLWMLIPQEFRQQGCCKCMWMPNLVNRWHAQLYDTELHELVPDLIP